MGLDLYENDANIANLSGVEWGLWKLGKIEIEHFFQIPIRYPRIWCSFLHKTFRWHFAHSTLKFPRPPYGEFCGKWKIFITECGVKFYEK